MFRGDNLKKSKHNKIETAVVTFGPNDIITKANSLVEASYNLSLIEFKIVHAAIAKVRVTDEEFYVISFKVKELAEVCNIRMTDSWTGIRKAIENIMKKVLSFETEEGKQVITHWFSNATYTPGSGFLELKIHSALEPVLLNLQKRFTSIKLSELSKFDSLYSARIYELLYQYKKIGVRQVEIESFKKMLQITSKAYSEFSNIRIRIIEPAIAEINEKTNYEIKCEYKKTGRKVTSLNFLIKMKKNGIVENEISPFVDEDDLNIEEKRRKNILPFLLKVGLEKKLDYFCNKYKTNRIIKNINYTLNNSQKSNIDNLSGYATVAIEKDYAGSEEINLFESLEEKTQELILLDNFYEDIVPTDPYWVEKYNKVFSKK